MTGMTEWLKRVPVDDPVDRRNAPMLQVVLLLLGVLPPLLWLYRVAASNIPWRPGETLGMLVSLGISAIALFGVLLIRRGHFQWAIRQMLVLVALTMILSYATEGSAPQAFEQPLQVVWIVLAGMMIGRGALWLMYAAILLAYVAGGVHDAQTSTSTVDTGLNLAMSVLIEGVMFLLIAVVVDRGVMALRETLVDATLRGDALALANRQLEIEMAERVRTEDQLIHARKVEAVGRLTSGIAHDFNHLLSLILGYAAKGRRSDDGEDLKRALAGVEAAGRRAAAVTGKLLEFSRGDTGRVERFDVAAAMRDLEPLLRQLFDTRVRIRFDLAQGPLPIDFDRAHLDLVVLNIAGNANQAMPGGGEFHLALRPSDDGAFVEIEMHDTGHGMSEEVRERLFEPFFTTRPAGQGTGVGLSVVHDLVVAAGGSIDVDSLPGQGSRFRVRLPRTADG